MKMRERLYLVEDRSRAVSETDRSGRHLLCKNGAELDDKVAARYGLVDGRLSSADPSVDQVIAPEVKRTVRKSAMKKFNTGGK